MRQSPVLKMPITGNSRDHSLMTIRCQPPVIGDLCVFPTCLRGSCDYRLYSPDSRCGSGTARAAQRDATIQPSIAARDGGRQRQSPDWVAGRLTPGQVPVRRTAPDSSRGAATRRPTRKAAPRRNPASERRSTPTGPAQHLHHRHDAPSLRGEPTVRERAALASGRDSCEWTGRTPARPARLDYLQMRQQSRAEIALQEGRAVTRRQGSRDRWRGDLRR